MSDYRKMLKDMGSFAITPFATALITLLVLPIISRVYPADEYGKINLFFSTGTILMYLFSLGLDSTCIRYYNEPQSLQAGFSVSQLLGYSIKVASVVTIVVGGVCVLFFGSEISQLLFETESVLPLLLLILFTAALGVFRLLNVKARMEMNPKVYNLQCVSQNLITRALFVVVVFVSTDYLPSIVFMTIALVFLGVIFLVRERDGFDFSAVKKSKHCLKTMYSFGIASMLTILVLQLNSNIGKYVLSSFGQYDAVGVFAVATTLATAFNVLPSAFGTYWSPYMYKNYKNDQNTIKHVHDYVLVGSIVVVALILLLQNVLYALIGGGYSDSQSYFMLVMLGPIASFLCETTSYGIPLSGRVYLNSIACAFGAISNFVIDILTIPLIGASGAAIGVAVSALIMGILRTIWGQKYYRSITSWRKTILGSIIIILLCVANYFVFDSVLLRLACVTIALGITMIVYRTDVISLVLLIRKRRQIRRDV